MTVRHRVVRRYSAAAVALVAVGVSGCGIRTTEGPVGAGNPAVRASQSSIPQPGEGRHDVFLVRNNLLVPVARSGALPLGDAAPAGERSARIDRLLTDLWQGPTETEAAQGYSTGVPFSGVKTIPLAEDDPPQLVRLDIQLGTLAKTALGQIVCTLQAASGPGAGMVLLAGRRGGPEKHQCTTYQSDMGKPPAPREPSIRPPAQSNAAVREEHRQEYETLTP
jgi:hypothetical protein